MVVGNVPLWAPVLAALLVVVQILLVMVQMLHAVQPGAASLQMPGVDAAGAVAQVMACVVKQAACLEQPGVEIHNALSL